MRILHVVGAMNVGGTETWLLQLLRHFHRQKYQIDILVHTTKPGDYDKEVKDLCVRIIPCLKPSNPLTYAYNFRRIILAYGPYDCVHCHMHQFTGYVLFLAALMGIPMRLAHSHTDTRKLDRNAFFVRKAYIRCMEFLVQRYATRGVAITANAAASLFSESWKDDPRWSICPTGIDFGPFEEDVNRSAVRAELGITPDEFVIGHVGRFVEVKNHRLVVEIAAHLIRIEPRARFLLVGDGPLRREIEALVEASGLAQHFIFAGNRRDVPRLMKGAMDCFLFPSKYEGLGRVVWEAQAAALPCLVSDSIPDEACATTFARRVPLGALPRTWADAVLQMRCVDRSRLSLSSEGISITDSIAVLKTMYSETAT